MKTGCGTFQRRFLAKFIVVCAAMTQWACSPAHISVLGASSLANLLFPTWTIQYGAGAGDTALYSSGQAGNVNVITDSSGNVTVCAATNGHVGSTFPFAPYSGNSTDIYVARFNKLGILQWSIQLSGGGSYVSAINGCLDDGLGDGYVYLAANSYADFHSYSGMTLYGSVLTGGLNSLMFKIAPNGAIVWGLQVSAGTGTTSVNGAAFDNSGNFTVIGSAMGTYLTGTQISTGTPSISNLNGFIVHIAGTAPEFRLIRRRSTSTPGAKRARPPPRPSHSPPWAVRVTAPAATFL